MIGRNLRTRRTGSGVGSVRPSPAGPGPLAPAALSTLDLSVRRRVAGLLPGDYRSGTVGSGTEVAVIRPYHAGDDVRHIDWNVTARTGEPHVRERVAERALTSWLLLDVSASMLFGTADRRKWDVAQGAAIALSHLASRRGNRVGVLAFGGGKLLVAEPRTGRGGIACVLTTVGAEPVPEPVGTTSLAEPLRRAARLAGRGALVVIISDFRGPLDWGEALAQVGARSEVLAVEVRDPREQALPAVGHLWLVDPETGRQILADTSSRRLRSRFALAAEEERAEVAGTLCRGRADHIVLSTSGDWLRTLAVFLKRRSRTSARA